MPKGTNQKFKLYRLAQIMLEQTDVVRELRRALCNPAEDGEDLAVKLSRIRLAGNGEARGVAHLLRNLAVELAHLGVIAVKQLEEARLRSGGALRAEKLRL